MRNKERTPSPRQTDRRKTAGILFLAFLLPAVLLLMVYASLGFAPFGDRSVLIMDMTEQNAPIIAALRQIISGKGSILFSWGKSMGTNFIGCFAFYASSPLTFLLFLLPESYYLLGLFYLTVFKISLSGLTMAIFLCRFLQRKPMGLLMLSTCYALMSYNLVYSLSIMWLDVVFWLPIVLLGIEWILERKSPLLLIISMALMFLSNYYISYMAGLFSALYFLYRFFSEKGFTWKRLGVSLLQFGGSVFLAIGLSAWITLPTFFDLVRGKMTSAPYRPDEYFHFRWAELFPKFLAGSYDTIQYGGLPSIFCGTAVLVLVLVYFAVKKISLKEKLLSVGFLVFMLLSFWLVPLDTVWHVFQSPNWFPFRYAFVFSFLLVFLAARALQMIEVQSEELAAVGKKALPICSGVLGAVFLVFTCAELFYNAKTMLQGLDREFRYRDTAEFYDFYDPLRPLVQQAMAEQQDGADFYRVEKDFEFCKNDALVLGYPGITHYSSAYNKQINRTLRQLGFAQDYFWNSYFGSTPLTDSLFSVRYVMAKNEYPSFYKKIGQNEEETVLYQNPDALPAAFGASQDILAFQTEGYHYFETQNRFISAICGKECRIFQPVEYQKQGVMSYTFIAPSENPVYLSLASHQHANAQIYVNGTYHADYFGSATKHVLFLGEFAAGEEVTVECRGGDEIILLSEDIYMLDQESYQNTMQELRNSGLRIEKAGSASVSGTVTLSEDGYLFTSIPYDPGFRVWVDGEKVESQTVNDTFLTVPVPAGTHRIKISYSPTGFVVGLCLTVISLLVLAALLWRYIYLKKRKMKLDNPF